MGVKKTKGKERRDHYYNLAKLQGYRARSAFKLIHLAQKHNFFASCQSLLDLCAAPGGWLQVAKQNMPLSSTIIGVDLVPIRTVQGCITIQADITTPRCRSLIKKHLEPGTINVVLHDGSPNVGTSWVHDAFVQNELTLHAAKLACEFLCPGGTFVTKVFRSQDYASLLWVFNQLFEKVTATKPQSSRDQSAEIFVVCNRYKSPRSVDSRFFDPKFAFLSLDSNEKPLSTSSLIKEADRDTEDNSSLQKKTSVKEILRTRSKKNRGGYEEGDDYCDCDAMVFFNASNPADVITRHNKLTFDSLKCERILKSPRTTAEIRAICADLKVSGRRELTELMRWRFRVLRDWTDEEKKVKSEECPDATEVDAEKCEIEFDEKTAEEELEGLVGEEAFMRRRVERKRKAKERKIEWRKKVTCGAFPETDEVPDLFRQDLHADALEEQDRLGIDVADLIDSEDENDQYIDAPHETYTTTFGGEESTDHLADMELDLDIGYRMQQLRKSKRGKVPESFINASLTRRKRVEKERSEELKKFEEDLTSRAREMMFDKEKNEESSGSDGDHQNAADDEAEEEQWYDDDGNKDDGIIGDIVFDAVADRKEREAKDKAMATAGTSEKDTDTSEHDAVEEAKRGKLRKKATQPVDHSVSTSKSKKQSSSAGDPPCDEFRKLKAERWFGNPLFDAVGGTAVLTTDAKKIDVTEGSLGHDTKVKREREGKKRKEIDQADDDNANESGSDENHDNAELGVNSSDFIREAPDDELPLLPLCDKKKKQLKRKKEQVRQDAKKRRKDGDQDLDCLGAKDQPFEKVPFEEVSVSETVKPPTNRDDIAKIQAIGTLLTRKKSRMDTIDSAFNRYAFNDEACLPDWFVHEESKHNKPEIQLPKELEAEFRQRLREIQERPIRKVLEAKFRKKKRLQQKKERLNKQANIIASSPDLTEAARVQSIRRLVGKSKKDDKRPKKYLVSRTGGGAKILRPHATLPKNSIVKVVDKRLKKDKRGLMRAQKKGKKVYRKRK